MSTYDLGHGTEGAAVLHDATPRPARRAVPAHRPTGSRMAFRTALVALTYVAITGGLLAGLLKEFRDGEISAGRRELGAFAQLAAGHTFEVALALEQSLKLAEVTLSVAAGSSAANQDSMGPMLHEIASNSRSLKDVLVLDARGRVMFQGNGSGDIGLDWSERPFFLNLQRNPKVQFAFGAPFQRTGAAEWLIPVTYAWHRSNGEFAGVVLGLMDPEFFAKAWRFDSEIAGLSIALASADGTLIARRPFRDAMVTQPVIDEATRRENPAGQQADTLVTSNPQDGQSELLAYRRVAA